MNPDDFRRVHPLTPLLRFWTLILALFAALALNLNISSWQAIWTALSDDSDLAIWPLLASIGGFLLACGLVWLLSRIWWKATGFRLTDEEIQHRRGVLNTQLRTARYDRIQAVDLVESVIARIFRMAAVRVETAGGTNSVIEIAFLKRAEAEDLRRQLIDATHGQRFGGTVVPGQEGAEGAEIPEGAGVPVGPVVWRSGGGAPGGGESSPVAFPDASPDASPGTFPDASPVPRNTVVPSIPIIRTLGSTALSLNTVITALALLIVVFTPLGFTALVPVLVGLVPSVWNLIDKSWKFQADLTGDVLNVSYGLADRRRQSIPLDRIHGVSVTQPLLWRLFGWWTVSVSVAGYGVDTKQGGTTRLLPVGTKDLALHLVDVVGPLNHGELETYADPTTITRPTYTSPPQARWVSPVDRKQQGVTLVGESGGGAPRAVIVHSGRFYHRMALIDVSHIQELTLQRGPIQKLLDLSTVKLNLVPGPVSMQGSDLSYTEGMALLTVLRRRSLPELTGPVVDEPVVDNPVVDGENRPGTVGYD